MELSSVWEDWDDWDECTTAVTCGLGTQTRRRQCTNGGKPGFDRMCMGTTNQTKPCRQPSCFGMYVRDILICQE